MAHAEPTTVRLTAAELAAIDGVARLFDCESRGEAMRKLLAEGAVALMARMVLPVDDGSLDKLDPSVFRQRPPRATLETLAQWFDALEARGEFKAHRVTNEGVWSDTELAGKVTITRSNTFYAAEGILTKPEKAPEADDDQ